MQIKGGVQIRRFDYSFLENGMLPAGLINVLSSIIELRERENSLKDKYPDVFTRLESVAKVQSVKGSNEIEGIVTSDERVNVIVNRNVAPQNHSEMEIVGYRDALALIHSSYKSLEIRERDILLLHEKMLSYLPVGGGSYKNSDNVIMELGSDGMRHVIFMPVSTSETAKAMEQLVLTYIDSRDNYAINKLLLIPCFIIDFLCIHPFSDGNGRMSRLLSLMLLYKSGFDAGQYISFEEQISLNKQAYYSALKESSKGWHDGNNSYLPFIENFVATLLICYKELDKRFATFSAKVTKRQRVEETILKSLLPISKSEVCYILPDVSPTTVEAVIGAMIKSNLIKKIGVARNTKYIKA